MASIVTKQATVLVVDDEPAIRKVVRHALNDLGCADTYTAPTAEQALELIQLRQPDIVITDVKLPGMDGVELARRIKALDGTVVMLMSAYSEPANHPADDFIAKPFDIDELAAHLGQYL